MAYRKVPNGLNRRPSFTNPVYPGGQNQYRSYSDGDDVMADADWNQGSSFYGGDDGNSGTSFVPGNGPATAGYGKYNSAYEGYHNVNDYDGYDDGVDDGAAGATSYCGGNGVGSAWGGAEYGSGQEYGDYYQGGRLMNGASNYCGCNSSRSTDYAYGTSKWPRTLKTGQSGYWNEGGGISAPVQTPYTGEKSFAATRRYSRGGNVTQQQYHQQARASEFANGGAGEGYYRYA